MTKEELLKQLGKLEADLDYWKTIDYKTRKEFAKAFNWYKEKGQYDYMRELKDPTWEEIFVQLGKELARLNAYDMDGNISALECAVEEIQNRLNNPN
jgi:hypothetical protein